jgi:serine/threonine-protein kinase
VLQLGSDKALVLSSVPALAVSPDGRYLVYQRGGASPLMIRAMDETEPQALAGTEGAQLPFFSPDSQSLGFVAGAALKRAALSGGAPMKVAGLTQMRGATWGDDGWIYYTPSASSGLWRVRADGGAPEQLTTPDFAQGEKSHRYPFVLPGGKAVLFVVATSRMMSFDDARIEAFSLTTRTRRRLIEGGTYPQYVPSGYLLYSRGGALLAVRFDPGNLEVGGSPIPLVEGMIRDPVYGSADYSFSREGTLVYVPGSNTALPQPLVATDRRGATQALRAEPGMFGGGSVSPDGMRCVVLLNGATSQITLIDLVRGTPTRLTFEWDNENPIWTPNGSRVTFKSNRAGGPFNLYWLSADGGGEPERLTTSDHEQVPFSWSPDGRTLAFVDTDTATGADIWVLSTDDKKARSFLKTPANESAPAFSPDGKWIAYQSNQSGKAEIYVQSFAPGGRRWQISSGGGTGPLWQRSGRELIYRKGPSVMAVPVVTSPGFSPGEPVKLFDTLGALIDLMPDGQRFLMLPAASRPAVGELNVIVNWFDELRRKAGVSTAGR